MSMRIVRLERTGLDTWTARELTSDTLSKSPPVMQGAISTPVLPEEARAKLAVLMVAPVGFYNPDIGSRSSDDVFWVYLNANGEKKSVAMSNL